MFLPPLHSRQLRRALLHQFFQPQVFPRYLLLCLCRALDTKSGMLVWDDVVFVFGIERLMLRWDVDVFIREMGRFIEFL